MSDLTAQPWFGWTLAVIIGLPVALLVLTEIYSSLARRGSRLARPLNLLRNFVLPAGALLLLITQATDVSVEVTWVRVLATVFGFLVIVLVLSGVNVALFGYARGGSWRQRMPRIFIDLGRLILIIIGLGILFSWVWGADVGGLFAALGVTSIVLGLALQDSVGGIISGLLLLFEQPFALGDWLQTNVQRLTVRGRIVEVNWRAVHLQTDDGLYIVPNAALASNTFTNLSRPHGDTVATVVVKFAPGDPPDEVLAVLERTAHQLPAVGRRRAEVSMTAPGEYRVLLPVPGPADIDATVALFQRWLWYAAQRSGVRLGGAPPEEFSTPERVEQALGSVVGALNLSAEDVAELVPSMRLVRYGGGETVLRAGERPTSLAFVAAGRVALTTPAGRDGGAIDVEHLGVGEPVDFAALTGEPSRITASAASPVTVLEVPMAVVDVLVRDRPQLARALSTAADTRRQAAASAGARPLRAPGDRPVAVPVSTRGDGRSP